MNPRLIGPLLRCSPLVLGMGLLLAATPVAGQATNRPPALKPLPLPTSKKTTTPAAKPAPAKPAPAPKLTTTPPKVVAVAGNPREAFDAAEKLYQEGKYEESLAAFRAFQTGVGKVSQLLPDAMYLEGWSAFNLRKFDEAEQAFGRLIEQYGGRGHSAIVEATLKRAECLREMKEFQKSIALYTSFLSNYSTNQYAPMAQLGIAWAYFGANEFPNAKAQLVKYRDSYPLEWQNNFDGLFLLAQIFGEEKNYKQAQEIYDLIAGQSQNPRATEALYLAGENNFEAKNYMQALRHYKRVQPTAALLLNIDQQLAYMQANRAGLVTQLGVQGYQARTESLQRMRTQIAERADLRASALFRIGNCYQMLRRPEEASIVYKHLMEKYPDPKFATEAHFLYIQMLSERKQTELATAETKIFKDKYPQYRGIDNVNVIQGENLYKLERYGEALKHYLDAQPTATDAGIKEFLAFRIPSCYYSLKNYEKANEGYTAFLSAYTEAKSKMLPDVLFRLSRTHFALADASKDPEVIKARLSDAIKYMERVRTEFPNPEAMPDVLFQLGYLYTYFSAHEPGANEKALSTFDAFLGQFELHRYATEVRFQRARVLAMMLRYDDAVAAFGAVIKKDPSHVLAAQAAYEIGATYHAAKRGPEMIAAFRELAAKLPEHPKIGDALYAIGQEFENQGRQLQAAGDAAGAAPKLQEAVAAYRDLVERSGKAADGEAGKNLRNAAIGAQLKLTALLEERTQVTEALEECEKFLVRFVDNPVASRQMIGEMYRLYRKHRRFKDGYAKFGALRQQFQANAVVRIGSLTGIVELGLNEGNYIKANEAAAQLLVDPAAGSLPVSTYMAIGKTLLETSQFERAGEAFDKMSLAHEDDPQAKLQALLGNARALLGQKKIDEAEKAYSQLNQGADENLRCDVTLGLAHVANARGRLQEAVDRFNAVLKCSRGEAGYEAAYHLGRIFFEMVEKDPKKKRDNFKAALAYFARLFFASGPMADEAAYMVGKCHEALGSPAAARNAYQNYLKRYPDGNFYKQADERVKALATPAR